MMRFSGFESDPRRKLDMEVVAKYPTYGAIVKVFLLDLPRRILCVLYSGSHSGTITLFFVPDWLRKPSVHIDTGIEYVSCFTCQNALIQCVSSRIIGQKMHSFAL